MSRAASRRFPTGCPGPTAPSKRYWSAAETSGATRDSARRQFRISPGGRTSYCSRRTPELPPSSAAVTTAVMWQSVGSHRRRPARTTGSPRPPPMATTRDGAREGRTEGRVIVADSVDRMSLYRPGQGAVDLDRDAPMNQLNGEHQQPLAGFRADENALHVRHRTVHDAHTLALTEVRVRGDWQARLHQPLDRFDLAIGHHGPLLPTVAEDGHEAARLAHLRVAPLVEGMLQEDVAREHRRAIPATHTSAPGPHVEAGQEHAKALGGELIADELLAVAPRPQHVPGRPARGLDGRPGKTFGDPCPLQHGSPQMSPMRSAAATTSVRVCTSSVALIFSTWSFTVCRLRCTSAPISLLVRPRDRWRTISMSMSESARVFLTLVRLRPLPSAVAAAMTSGATTGSSTDSPR